MGPFHDTHPEAREGVRPRSDDAAPAPPPTKWKARERSRFLGEAREEFASERGGLLKKPPKRSGQRGVVYVEFLISFFPVFLIFLSVCQLSLMTSAKIVVGQAANQGARSAVVVLEEDPVDFDGSKRGGLSDGEPNPDESIEALLDALGQNEAIQTPESPGGPQHGARMVPIRTAAYAPLIALSPHDRAWLEGGSVRDGVSSGFVESLRFALQYTRAATSISIHDSPNSETLARDPVPWGEDITLRVTYLFQCSIPLVRSILCKALSHWVPPADSDEDEPHLLAQSELPDTLSEIAPESARFLPIVSEVTLPLQSAGYYGRTR